MHFLTEMLNWNTLTSDESFKDSNAVCTNLFLVLIINTYHICDSDEIIYQSKSVSTKNPLWNRIDVIWQTFLKSNHFVCYRFVKYWALVLVLIYLLKKCSDLNTYFIGVPKKWLIGKKKYNNYFYIRWYDFCITVYYTIKAL